MKKKIITISLLCSSLLYANLVEDIKKETNNSIHKTKEKYHNYMNKKEKEKKAIQAECINTLEEHLPHYGLYLEKYYMDVNRKNEAKIIQNYKKLESNGISPQLTQAIDSKLIAKLSYAKSTLEYSAIILSELKGIENGFKKHTLPTDKDSIEKIKFLMYAWTTPMEILSTKNIYNNSLLGLSEELNKHLIKNNYQNYTNFIYSMLYVNLMEESIAIKKKEKLNLSEKLHLASATLGEEAKEKKGLSSICTSVKYASEVNEYLLNSIGSTLNIEEDSLGKEIDEISRKNNLFESPILFDKKKIALDLINTFKNPLNDNWYLMIREYMALQDDFYKIKKEIDKIIKTLESLPNNEKAVATLKQNIFEIDTLYRKFDESVRFNIIDLPISIYADLYYIEFKKGKRWYNDDEKFMGNIAIGYNKSCANMQKYMVSEFAINKVIRITKTLKKEFNEDEWKEIKTKAKLTQDWFNMLNKVKISNK